jgi:cobalt/nickel transport protein
MKEKYLIFGLLVALLMASVISLYASPEPDGLERVAEDHGFLEQGEEPPLEVMPDYVIPGIENEIVAASLAGLLGVFLMFGLGIGLGKAFKGRGK